MSAVVAGREELGSENPGSEKWGSDASEAGPVVVYTDGACSGNPGPGGWGATLRYGDHVMDLCGGAADTTNNRMELTAPIEALKALNRRSAVILYTDSTYVKNGITSWIANWARNGWKTKDKKPVKNAELWRELQERVAEHDVEWRWVKGHAGDPGNERADELARTGMEPYKLTK